MAVGRCSVCGKLDIRGHKCKPPAKVASSSSSSSSSSTSTVQTWDSLGALGRGTRQQKITSVTELPTDALGGRITWSDLLVSLHTTATFSVDLKDLSADTPRDGMSFSAGTCTLQEGLPFQLTNTLSVKRGAKKGGSACYEAGEFPQGLGTIGADDIVLVHQSHAPCSACCGAFAGWAKHITTPIVVAFEYGDGATKSKSGTYFFLPAGGSYYVLKWSPILVVKKAPAKQTSSSSST